MAVTARTRADIERQHRHDALRVMNENLLKVRYRATLEAFDAILAEEEGSHWALRQSLLDIASCCLVMLDEMPVPRERD